MLPDLIWMDHQEDHRVLGDPTLNRTRSTGILRNIPIFYTYIYIYTYTSIYSGYMIVQKPWYCWNNFLVFSKHKLSGWNFGPVTWSLYWVSHNNDHDTESNKLQMDQTLSIHIYIHDFRYVRAFLWSYFTSLNFPENSRGNSRKTIHSVPV